MNCDGRQEHEICLQGTFQSVSSNKSYHHLVAVDLFPRQYEAFRSSSLDRSAPGNAKTSTRMSSLH